MLHETSFEMEEELFLTEDINIHTKFNLQHFDLSCYWFFFHFTFIKSLLFCRDFKAKYLKQSPTRIGSKYKKAVYILYKNESFTEKLETKQRKNELGILGPVIRAQIRDVIKASSYSFTKLKNRKKALHASLNVQAPRLEWNVCILFLPCFQIPSE